MFYDRKPRFSFERNLRVYFIILAYDLSYELAYDLAYSSSIVVL